MSNGELEARMAALAEQVADRPSGSFETADAFGAAVTADLPRPEDHSSFLETVRDHWDRVRWLHEHVAHGTLTFVPHESVRPRPCGLWGPGVIATCSCSATLKMFREQVPAEHLALLSVEGP